MATIVYDGKQISIPDGKKIKEYVKHLDIPFGCEHGVCGTCQIDIISGEENLAPLTEAEEDMERDRKHRLACQCKILKGNVEIRF